ncbi:MAG: SUMF1/EgtB/PvdO family nonheme iron enzyme [Anaerolineales bacterium]|nr:SUMF1/EgtB/PvdO family nonheme iron enzyme [Anaerolineales bacterium]
MARKIFLSYSWQDMLFIEELVQDLEKAGYDVWYDLTNIEGGSRWEQEIQKGINQSQVFALVVSSGSTRSEWVEQEFRFASKRGMKIVLLLHELCELPLWLMNMPYIDIVGRNYAKNFYQVREAFDNYGRRAGDVMVDAVEQADSEFLWKTYLGWIAAFAGIAALAFAVTLWLRPVRSAPMPQPAPTQTLFPSPTHPPFTATAASVPTATATVTAIPPTTPTVTPVRTLSDASGAEMILIPSGSFLMGSDGSEADETPAHTVLLGDFYMDAYEVTNAQYSRCVDALDCALPVNTSYYVKERFNDHPVVFVDWQRAADYCAWRRARLPSEAEWEKAARGATHSDYPWGSTFNGNALNFCDASCRNSWATGQYNDRYAQTSPVGLFPAGQSIYGVYDLAGNVAEWVDDWYAADYYKMSPLENPLGAQGGRHKVLRGGSWYSNSVDVRTYKRDDLAPNTAFNYIGFRCARSP